MSSIATEGLKVRVNLPRSYMGPAELQIGRDSVTLIARPLRHYRAIVLLFAVVFTVLVLIGGVFSWSGQLSLREPGLSGPALTAARQAAYGAPLVIGVLGGLLAGGMALLFSALRGDPRRMSLPTGDVSLVEHRGRLLVLRAPFDSEARSANWKLFAGSRDEAKAIESALTSPGS